ncbi:hypothetical protein ACH5RR_015506 [Cinchona calisaya]|uniref:Uncharacterized protein n=1 Tax=Cinchona calisaya TaxID=153742 RepID=A0ABD2ZTC6_9GENT
MARRKVVATFSSKAKSSNVTTELGLPLLGPDYGVKPIFKDEEKEFVSFLMHNTTNVVSSTKGKKGTFSAWICYFHDQFQSDEFDGEFVAGLGTNIVYAF